MYIIIFCKTNDLFVHALCKALLEKGKEKIRVVTDTELVFASWVHEAGSDGSFFTRIGLRDGFIIEPSVIKAVVNRIPYFQMVHFINQADRSYAEMEIYALYISFLRSIEAKVTDGMQVRHINIAEPNALYFGAIAVKAGMEVLDNQFTSSPRWQQPRQLTAMTPWKKPSTLWHKRSPHLIWENKPVLYNESFATLVKAEVVNNTIFWPGQPVKGWQKKIKTFSQLIGRTVYTLTLAEVKGKYKFYEVDTRPQIINVPAINAFAALLISKNKS
ncbi:MAG: hypothetical protein NVSMB7_09400 [Chitinophagaceae bacterium]